MREPPVTYPKETVVTPRLDSLQGGELSGFTPPGAEGNLSSRSGNADPRRAGSRNGRALPEAHEAVSRLRASGILLGIGLGGFVDGIVLHKYFSGHMLTSEAVIRTQQLPD